MQNSGFQRRSRRKRIKRHIRKKIVGTPDRPRLLVFRSLKAIYAQLVAEGLHVGMQLRVLEISPQRVRFWAGGDEHILAPILAANIAVEPLLEESPESLEDGEPLTTLQVGETAQIQGLSPRIRGAERRRLMDLGILPGTEPTCGERPSRTR